MLRTASVAITALLLSGSPALGEDFDGDGVEDPQDNCLLIANPAQDDTDGDFCGNLCDADYDNNGLVGFADFAQFGVVFGKSTDLEKDHTEPVIGPVGFADYALYGKTFGKAPGPSGTTPGTFACPLQ